MAGNPLIDQGHLNRLLGSCIFADFPQLNVTASFLGKQGIRAALQGEATQFIETMVGAVTSGEPYVRVQVTINLLKSQNLAALFKKQMELNSALGGMNVQPDSVVLPQYNFTNCAIQSVPDLNFAGDDASFNVVIGGYYNINSALWNLT